MAKKQSNGIAVNQCTVCDYWKLTMGQQSHGGVRVCIDCLPFTLAWVRMGDEGQQRITEMFTMLGAQKKVQAAIARAQPLNDDPELRKAHGIGEAKRHLYESLRRE